MPLEIYCFASLITSMCPYWGRLPDLLFAMEFKIFRLKHVCLHWNGLLCSFGFESRWFF